MNRPTINVTPLIDVLLVLLIIFMVITPLKPSSFETRIPAKPKEITAVSPNIFSLVVAIEPDSSLRLNGENNVGAVTDSEKLIGRLRTIFAERKENGVYSLNAALNANLPEDEKIEKTVFIKASRATDYGSVAKVIDAVKISGASPISLQIDNLP